MVTGGSMVFIWNLLIRPFGGIFDIYELLPAFLLFMHCNSHHIISLTPEESKEIQEEI